jgi:hypothetical protein
MFTRGVGDYDKVGSYASLFYTPPYNFMIPGKPPAENYYSAERMGLGCADCGGTCGGLGGVLDNVNWSYVAVYAIGGYILWRGLADARRRNRSRAAARRVKF